MEISYSNRGKSLEDDLNETNMFYLNRNMANIHKKPVPIQIVKVDYPARSAAVIREAYFRTPSLGFVDFASITSFLGEAL